MNTRKFNLIENALDSLEHAIEHLTLTEDMKIRDFKRAILDLSHVAELLFKERLTLIHPAFVFSNVDKYPSKNAFTVSAGEALKRLQDIGEIHFDEEDKVALKNIREKRNEIEHYTFEISEKEAKVLIGNILAFIFKFSLDELDLNWADRRLNDKTWIKLNEYSEFYQAQRNVVLKMLQNSDIATQECPMCHSETFDTESERCLLCGHNEELFDCERCKSRYLNSDVLNIDINLCSKCEEQEGYAAHNFEKY